MKKGKSRIKKQNDWKSRIMKHIYFYGDSNTHGYDPFDFYAGRYPEELVWTNIVQRELDGWRVTADVMNGRGDSAPRRGVFAP